MQRQESGCRTQTIKSEGKKYKQRHTLDYYYQSMCYYIVLLAASQIEPHQVTYRLEAK
jgi:hypothetical protein